MLGLARLAVLGAALALAGCKTVENSLTANDISSMKLTAVTVSYTPEATVQWEDGIRAYAAAKSIPDHELTAAANTPEGKAYVQNALAPQIKSAVEFAMGGALTGTRPVRLEIVVKNFIVAGAVQRILIGGHRGMMADANLVDARTGAVIISHPDLQALLYTGQGVGGVIVQAAIDSANTKSVAQQVADRYGQNYRDWLIRKTS
nr:hypothetical protein [Bradyrhizobium lablabi]